MAGTFRIGGKVLATHDSGTDEISLDSATNTSNMSFDANHAGIKTALNASGDAPIYACRAWVNFRGSSISGTLNTSGPVTGLYTATVTSATTFTIEYSSTTYTVTTSSNHDVGDGEGVDLTISGTSVTIDTQIRESGNVSSITDNSSGNWTVNFTTAMPDANYAAFASFQTPVWGDLQIHNYNFTTSGFIIGLAVNTNGTGTDAQLILAAVFR
jgi:hypothetical protein